MDMERATDITRRTTHVEDESIRALQKGKIYSPTKLIAEADLRTTDDPTRKSS